MKIKHIDNLIIGSGVAGLSVSFELKKHGIKSTILESESESGGLCRSFKIGTEWFDYGGHVAFSKNNYVRQIMEANGSVDFYSSFAEASNYKNGVWVRNPAQNNIKPLPTDEKVNIIKGFVERRRKEDYGNYDEWLRGQYGDYFAENYPAQYTRKYWTVEPSQLETKWIGPRMYTPTLDEVIRGAIDDDGPCVHYSDGVRYPLEGGYGAFIQHLIDEADIILDMKVCEIDFATRIVRCSNNSKYHFDRLVICAPLPEIIPAINQVPINVLRAARALNHTSAVMISLLINKVDLPAPAFYIYDEDKAPSRVFSTTLYGGMDHDPMALQAEVYFSRFKPQTKSNEEIMDDVISQLIDMKLIKEADILEKDVRCMKYANIIFTHDIYDNRRIIHEYLREKGVFYAGRYADWDYEWSHQSILSGIKEAERMVESYV